MERNPFERITTAPLDVIKAAGHWALELVSMHQLASHGSHFIHETTDTTQENQGVLRLFHDNTPQS